MKKAEFVLQYLHFKKSGLDVLNIQHSRMTNFANPDSQLETAQSRSLQRADRAAVSASKKSSASRSSLTRSRRQTATFL
ncbi:hypothetical protein [Rhizobium sp. 21-4511-3d]